MSVFLPLVLTVIGNCSSQCSFSEQSLFLGNPRDVYVTLVVDHSGGAVSAESERLLFYTIAELIELHSVSRVIPITFPGTEQPLDDCNAIMGSDGQWAPLLVFRYSSSERGGRLTGLLFPYESGPASSSYSLDASNGLDLLRGDTFVRPLFDVTTTAPAAPNAGLVLSRLMRQLSNVIQQAVSRTIELTAPEEMSCQLNNARLLPLEYGADLNPQIDPQVNSRGGVSVSIRGGADAKNVRIQIRRAGFINVLDSVYQRSRSVDDSQAGQILDTWRAYHPGAPHGRWIDVNDCFQSDLNRPGQSDANLVCQRQLAAIGIRAFPPNYWSLQRPSPPNRGPNVTMRLLYDPLSRDRIDYRPNQTSSNRLESYYAEYEMRVQVVYEDGRVNQSQPTLFHLSSEPNQEAPEPDPDGQNQEGSEERRDEGESQFPNEFIDHLDPLTGDGAMYTYFATVPSYAQSGPGVPDLPATYGDILAVSAMGQLMAGSRQLRDAGVLDSNDQRVALGFRVASAPELACAESIEYDCRADSLGWNSAVGPAGSAVNPVFTLPPMLALLPDQNGNQVPHLATGRAFGLPHLQDESLEDEAKKTKMHRFTTARAFTQSLQLYMNRISAYDHGTTSPTLMVYFSGHAHEDGSLIFSDFDAIEFLRNPPVDLPGPSERDSSDCRSSLKAEDQNVLGLVRPRELLCLFRDHFETNPASELKIILVMDSCYSGNVYEHLRDIIVESQAACADGANCPELDAWTELIHRVRILASSQSHAVSREADFDRQDADDLAWLNELFQSADGIEDPVQDISLRFLAAEEPANQYFEPDTLGCCDPSARSCPSTLLSHQECRAIKLSDLPPSWLAAKGIVIRTGFLTKLFLRALTEINKQLTSTRNPSKEGDGRLNGKKWSSLITQIDTLRDSIDRAKQTIIKDRTDYVRTEYRRLLTTQASQGNTASYPFRVQTAAKLVAMIDRVHRFSVQSGDQGIARTGVQNDYQSQTVNWQGLMQPLTEAINCLLAENGECNIAVEEVIGQWQGGRELSQIEESNADPCENQTIMPKLQTESFQLLLPNAPEYLNRLSLAWQTLSVSKDPEEGCTGQDSSYTVNTYLNNMLTNLDGRRNRELALAGVQQFHDYPLRWSDEIKQDLRCQFVDDCTKLPATWRKFELSYDEYRMRQQYFLWWEPISRELSSIGPSIHGTGQWRYVDPVSVFSPGLGVSLDWQLYPGENQNPSQQSIIRGFVGGSVAAQYIFYIPQGDVEPFPDQRRITLSATVGPDVGIVFPLNSKRTMYLEVIGGATFSAYWTRRENIFFLAPSPINQSVGALGLGAKATVRGSIRLGPDSTDQDRTRSWFTFGVTSNYSQLWTLGTGSLFPRWDIHLVLGLSWRTNYHAF